MLHDPDLVSVQEVRNKVEKAYAAWTKYRSYTQEQVDAIVERMAEAGRANARRLAEMAVSETGYGNVPDKIGKNLLCADYLPRAMRGMKTVGVIRELPEQKLVEIAEPMGVVAAILPTTNPTSTAIYKILISLKAGNAIVLSPHPRARGCTCETADLLHRAAVEAGAPEDIIQCVTTSTMEATNELMRHRRTGVILSTGGAGIVRAAYSSGKPAFGVGPGNVPVLIDTSADVAQAVAKVVQGKSFDYGTVCSSEQSIVAELSLKDRILAELRNCRAHLSDAHETAALAKLLVRPNFTINPDCVGQSPAKIARMAGFEVPPDTSILTVEISGVGREHPLSVEKLSPVLSLLFVSDFTAAAGACESILRFGGLGHTCCIYSADEARIRKFARLMPAFRILVNTPSPQGSTGITTNLFPSMTLGCGAAAGNVTSDNVGPQHLFNIKRLAYVVRTTEEAIPSLAAAQAGVPKSPPVAPPSPGSGGVDRQALTDAVERYLKKRGLSTAPPPRPETAELVERFLTSRRTAAVVTPCATCPTCPSPKAHAAASPEPPAPPPAAPAPPKPEVQIVDFVCEEDVRVALRESRKIYIGPKTIVTPSARDLGTRHDVLVLAQR